MKKAIRISIDGSNNAVNESEEQIMKQVSQFPSEMGRSGASIRISGYQPDNPEIMKMESAKMLRWLAGDEKQNGNPVSDGDPEVEEVQDEKFLHQLKRVLGPFAKGLADEVVWGPGGKKARDAKAAKTGQS